MSDRESPQPSARQLEHDPAHRLLRAIRDERTLEELRHTPQELRDRAAERAKALWEVRPEPPLPCDAGRRLMEAIRGAETDPPADAGERLLRAIRS